METCSGVIILLSILYYLKKKHERKQDEFNTNGQDH